MDKTLVEIIFGQKYIYILIGIVIITFIITILLLFPQTREIIQKLLDRIVKINVKCDETSIELSEKTLEHSPKNTEQSNTYTKKDDNTPQSTIDLKTSKFKKVKIRNFFGNLKARRVILDDVEINGVGSLDDVNNRK